MSELEQKLTPFARRIRVLSAWRGLAVGACCGAGLDLTWSVLDWTRVLYADWVGLGVVFGSGALLGMVIGFLRKVNLPSIAKSVDLRAQLKDRLETAVTPPSDSSIFEGVQQSDAERSLEGVQPAKLYPFRFGRWQTAALAAAILAASVFLLGNSPVVRGPKNAAERKELAEIGQKVERIAKPLEKEVKPAAAASGQKKLAGDMNRFAKELEQGKLNKEEAIRKANEMASKAEEDAKSKADEALRKTEKAETALGKYQKLKLDESGANVEDLERLNLTPEQQAALDRIMQDKGMPQTDSKFSDNQLKEMGSNRNAERLSQLTPEQREQLRQEVAKRQSELQKEMDRIDKLPESERKKLEAERAEMQKQMQEMQQLGEKLKLSEEAVQALRELMQSEEMKKLRETMSKMQQSAEQTSQGQKLSKEQIEQLKQQIEELAQNMKNPEMREQIMQQLRDAVKQLESGQMSLEAAQQMLNAMGMSGGMENDPNGSPSTGSDDQFADTGKVVKSEHELETKGKGTPTRIQGQWSEKGDQWSVTVKAPTQVGNRSSVPYQSVMPKYKKAAEKALSGGKIPKEKEKRVKEYFDSLSGGR